MARVTPRAQLRPACAQVRIDVGKFRDITDDMVFTQLLLDEESVFVLPGKCFGQPNVVRIVFCAPAAKLAEAYDRMEAFCRRHAK